ncbi:MAG: peptidoglycan bridge formation glycyltransferase FemA/FemB family protein [Candidatus Paceibacterota bacterium]
MILSTDQKSPDNISDYYQLLDWAQLISQDYIALERIIINNKDGKIVIFSQIYVYKLTLKYTQLYIPRGPLLYTDNLSQEEIQEFWQNISKIAQKYNSVFTLIEPPQDIYNGYGHLFDTYTQNSDLERIPHQTQILDLTLSETDLLQNMHPKMRYNIRLAQKKGVNIKNISYNNSEFDKYFDIFFDLIQETSGRGEFAIHSKLHYRHLLKAEASHLQVSLIIAEHEDKVLAANIVLDTLDKRIYLHGASGNQYRNLMATPLLQWESILEAKKIGKKIYDFWGISNTKKSWQGISRFKIQFGGQSITYPNSQIVIHNSLVFKIYSIFRKIRGKFI